jgi:2-keto-4-pentenoate hydratase/2-oxohepta-3-ene-1,7-dioic acid hydratase in catechol pathway
VKLARIGVAGAERLAVMVEEDRAVFVDDVVSALSRETLGAGALARLSSLDLSSRPPVDVTGQRRGSPVERPTKIICVGLNYREHAIESGADIPTEPVLFMKSPDTLRGPQDDVLIPPGSVSTDYEVELAIVIGAPALYLDSDEAAEKVIAGYAVSQDVSERHWQLERGGQWDKGKSFPTFNPLGPYLVTPDEFDPQDQKMWCLVNAEPRQQSSVADMIFRPAEIVRYISNVMQLSPGDIINTGTPQGVGFGFKPPRYLAAGDSLETGIEGLGSQKSSVLDTR